MVTRKLISSVPNSRFSPISLDILDSFGSFGGQNPQNLLGKKHNLWGDDSSKSLHPSKHQKHTPEVAKERLPRSLDSWLAWSDQHNQATIRVDLGIFGIWQNVPK